jgi:hypothetical protein
MKKKLALWGTVLTVVVGAPFALADGILNDAQTTKELGGVGNYTTDAFRNKATADTNDVTENREPVADTQPAAAEPVEQPVAATESDTVDLGASSSGRAH